MARLVIAEGNSYTVATTYKSPQADDGFELFRIKDDGGKNEITCFLAEKSRPGNLAPGDTVKINKILSATLGWKKKKEWDKTVNGYVEKWKQEFTLTVEATKAASDLEDDLGWIDELEGAIPPWEDDLTP